MKAAARVLGVASGLVVGSAALWAQSAGPLEGTQQELKTLQSKQPADSGAIKASTTTHLPALQVMNPSATPLEIPAPRKMEQGLSKQQEARKNWLVDGVQQLKKIDNPKAAASGKNLPEDDLASEKSGSGQSGPQSLLEVYTAQQKQADDARRGNQSAAASRSGSGKDPLAPFLQEWMGNSPAHGKFFDEFARKSESSGSVNAAGDSPVTPNASSVADSTRPTLPESFDHAKTADRASNPYLEQTSGNPGGARDFNQTAIPVSSALQSSGGPINLPSSSASEPAPAARPASDKKAPLSGLADDKKYFPQLKKF